MISLTSVKHKEFTWFEALIFVIRLDSIKSVALKSTRYPKIYIPAALLFLTIRNRTTPPDSFCSNFSENIALYSHHRFLCPKPSSAFYSTQKKKSLASESQPHLSTCLSTEFRHRISFSHNKLGFYLWYTRRNSNAKFLLTVYLCNYNTKEGGWAFGVQQV